MIAGLSKRPSNVEEQRGYTAEEKAWKAAQYWKRKKIIFEVRRTEGFSPEDRQGKDLILTLKNGKEIFIDVKDYSNFKAIQKCKKRGVHLFPIWSSEGEDIAKERMLNLIFSIYISELEPYQVRKLIDKILETKKSLSVKSPKPNLIKKILSKLGKVG